MAHAVISTEKRGTKQLNVQYIPLSLELPESQSQIGQIAFAL